MLKSQHSYLHCSSDLLHRGWSCLGFGQTDGLLIVYDCLQFLDCRQRHKSAVMFRPCSGLQAKCMGAVNISDHSNTTSKYEAYLLCAAY